MDEREQRVDRVFLVRAVARSAVIEAAIAHAHKQKAHRLIRHMRHIGLSGEQRTACQSATTRHVRREQTTSRVHLCCVLCAVCSVCE